MFSAVFFGIHYLFSFLCNGEETVSYFYNYTEKKINIDGDDYEVISHSRNEFQLVTDYDDVDGDGIEDKIVLILIR